MHSYSRLSICMLLVFLLSDCSRQTTSGNSDAKQSATAGAVSSEVPALKDVYRPYFPIGVAVAPRHMEGADADFILRHFSSMTPENVMKMGPIHPEPNRYEWAPADRIVSFATQHGLKMRGHALCWHEQYPAWMFVDEQGDTVSKDVLLERLRDHIQTVVSRYRGKIYAWDVVNEAVADDSTRIYRNSPWYQISGEEYLAKAFEYAHAADPDARLFYNDYNAARPEKRERIYQLVKKLVDAGVPIHGVGIQGHWSIYEPSEADIRAAIEKYASLGLEVQITELDVSVYPWEKHRRERRPGESDAFTPELARQQAERYEMFFRVFRDYPDVLTSVTFWNLTDRSTWLDNYPVPGRKNYPLLFDADYQPKPAFWRVVGFD